MYDAEDLHGFVSFNRLETIKWLAEQQKESDEKIAALEKENKELKKENKSLGQQNAVLAGLVRATTGIQYKSDYE